MKYVKMLGLVALAASAMMALGASSASADVICTNLETPCKAANRVTILKPVAVGTTKLTTSFKTIECNKSQIEGTVTKDGEGNPIEASISTLDFEECNCEIKVLKNGTLKATNIAGTSNATVFSSGAEVTANCSTIFGAVHCIYATNNTHLGVVKGGENSTLNVEEAEIPRLPTSAICAEKAKWDAAYKIANHKFLYWEPK